jgi:hypothetical protein
VAEFVVAASPVLDERVTPDHRQRGRVRSQAAHWPEPRLESAVVALDAVVGVPGGVVEHFSRELAPIEAAEGEILTALDSFDEVIDAFHKFGDLGTEPRRPATSSCSWTA